MEKFRKADWQLLLAEITVRGWAGSAIDDPWLATDRLHKWTPIQPLSPNGWRALTKLSVSLYGTKMEDYG